MVKVTGEILIDHEYGHLRSARGEMLVALTVFAGDYYDIRVGLVHFFAIMLLSVQNKRLTAS